MKFPLPNAKKFLLLASVTLASVAAQLLIAAPAKAKCVYEGTDYQTGQTVGSLVCMPGGTWQRNS